MSQFQAQHFYCLKSERTVSGSVLNSQLIYENSLWCTQEPKSGQTTWRLRSRLVPDGRPTVGVEPQPFIRRGPNQKDSLKQKSDLICNKKDRATPRCRPIKVKIP